jgi:CheR methyltransferase, SAM binding domain
LLYDFSQLGVFDVILCRNVLIYFDQGTKIDTFNRLARATESDGFLVLGAAETVVGLTDVSRAPDGVAAQHGPDEHDHVFNASGATCALSLGPVQIREGRIWTGRERSSVRRVRVSFTVHGR